VVEPREKFTELQVFEQAKELIEGGLNIALSILEQRVLRSIHVPSALRTYENNSREAWDSIQPKIEASFRFLIDYFPISSKLAEFVTTCASPVNCRSGPIRQEYLKFMQDYEKMNRP